MKNFRSWGQDRARVLLLLTLALTQLSHHSEGIMLLVPDPVINATVAQNVLLSVEYICNGTPSIQWQYMTTWKPQCIIEWKVNSYINISKSYNGRVHNYSNGSIQLLNVEIRDGGFYMITLTDDNGNNKQSTIILNVHEVRYEEFYFVVVFIVFLAAGSAVLACLMWMCNKCINMCQRKKQHRRAEEIELRIISD
ncbi:V-set and transmembrane domain-containing protein 5 [Hyperolius riggenbachi]|uniref:V-set and transmembrane domain-containing protein 5 n=1 Tax=Hyperolius riggenbachi TaxID=752182 RepID=UPI0035A3AC1B